MMLSEEQAKEKIAFYAKSIFDRGLTSGASANMSVKIDKGWVITPTDTCFGLLDASSLSVVDRNGEHLSGQKPSKEFLLHKRMYEKRPQDTCIIHLHSTWATSLSCLPAEDESNVVPTYTPYLTMRLGAIAKIPYFSPGDEKLADAISEVAADHPGVIMANHGPIVSGETIEKTFYAMEELEESCKIAFILMDKDAVKLTREQIVELLERYK